MRFLCFLPSVAFAITLTTGCSSIRPDPTKYKPGSVTLIRSNVQTSWKTVVITPRTNVPTNVPLSTKLNPLWWCKNLDHPTAPDWYRPGKKMRNLRWNMRNPLNNFTFYVVGVGDKTFERSGRYPELVFNPEDGWSYSVTRYKRLRLPFVSYQRGKFKFYAGWRNRGNIGFKMTFK